MKTIAVYGSLKKGLHNDWGTRAGVFLGTATTLGDMYSLGGYPVLMKNGTKKYEIEVYTITDEMYKQITRMELGAGYMEEEINTPYEKAIIYYGDPTRYTKERLANLKAVDQWPPNN